MSGVEWLGSVPAPESSFLGTVPRGFFEEGTPGRCDVLSPAFIRGVLLPRAEYDAMTLPQRIALTTPPRWTLYGGPIQSVGAAQDWDAYMGFWSQAQGLAWIPAGISPLCIVPSFRLQWPQNSGFQWTWVRETEWPRRVVWSPSQGKYVWDAPGVLSGPDFLGQFQNLPPLWQYPAPAGWPTAWPWPLPVGWAPPGWPAGIEYPPISPTGAPPIAWETTGLPWPPPPQIWPFPVALPPGMNLPNVLGPPLTAPTQPPLPPVPSGWPIEAQWPLPPACWPEGVPFPPPAPAWWPKDVAFPPVDLVAKPPWWPSFLAWPPSASAIPGWPQGCPFPVALPTTPPALPPPTGPLPPPPPPIQDEVPGGPLPPPPAPLGAKKSTRGPVIVGGLIATAIAVAAAFAGD